MMITVIKYLLAWLCVADKKIKIKRINAIRANSCICLPFVYFLFTFLCYSLLIKTLKDKQDENTTNRSHRR